MGLPWERSSVGHSRRHAGWAKSQISPERSCPWSLAGVVWLRGALHMLAWTLARMPVGPGVLRQEVPWPSWADAL